ncbi:MAG: Basal-body rod modification protein FlgD [Pseudomonadota bacterium]|jgi:flagellar basal-body rod modification protein FlgD
MATTATSTLPSGIVKYEDYVAEQKSKPTNTNMGQTEFLTLFTTQLKNQNPLDPVKNEAFVAQLAQFSQLEATTAMKTSMQNLVSSLANDRLLGATSLIGKTVGVPDGPVAVTDTTVSQGVINVPTGADGIKVQIFNDKGILVRTQIMGPQPAGDVTIAWDGTNDGGVTVPNGTYRYVASVNSNGSVTKPTVNTYAQVTGVTSAGTADGTMLLEVAGGKTVNLADVKRISY